MVCPFLAGDLADTCCLHTELVGDAWAQRLQQTCRQNEMSPVNVFCLQTYFCDLYQHQMDLRFCSLTANLVDVLEVMVTFGEVVTVLVLMAMVNLVLGNVQNWKNDDRLLADLICVSTLGLGFVAWQHAVNVHESCENLCRHDHQFC